MNPAWFFLAHGIAWTALGTIILILVGWLNRYVSKNAAVRHFGWTVAFSGLCLLPLYKIARTAFTSDDAGASLQLQQSINPVSLPAASETARTSPSADCQPEPASKTAGSPLSLILAGIWLSGALLALGRFFVAWRQLQRWRSQSSVLPLETLELLQLNGDAGLSAKLELRLGSFEEPKIPITWGLWKPIVLLPKAAQHWSRSRLLAVLLHELGHVRRRDHKAQMLALLVCALHWFNPVFWRSARKMEAEAEIAADDCAILAGISPSTYATELLQLASQLRGPTQRLTLIETAMVKPFTVENRIHSIIDAESVRGPIGFWPLIGVQALSLLLLLPVGSLSGTLLKPFLSLPTKKSKPACIAQPQEISTSSGRRQQASGLSNSLPEPSSQTLSTPDYTSLRFMVTIQPRERLGALHKPLSIGKVKGRNARVKSGSSHFGSVNRVGRVAPSRADCCVFASWASRESSS